MLRRLRPALTGTLLALCMAPAGADADTYCVAVSDPTCTSTVTAATAGLALQNAIDAARTHAGDDTVRFGPGTYQLNTGFTAYDTSGATLRIQGPGTAQATLQRPAPNDAATFVLSGGRVALAGFSVVVAQDNAQTGAGIRATFGGTYALDDLVVSDPLPAPAGDRAAVDLADNLSATVNATLNDVRTSGAETGLWIPQAGRIEVTASALAAGRFALRQPFRSPTGGSANATTVSGSTLTATGANANAVFVGAGTAYLTGVDVTSSSHAALMTCLQAAAPSVLVLDRVTLDPGGSGKALSLQCLTSGTMTVSATGSLLVPPAGIDLSGDRPINVGLDRTRWDGVGSVTNANTAGAGLTVVATSAMTTVAPAFSTGHRLAAGSPLIDGQPALTTIEEGDFRDPDGGFLRRDGNDDGTVRSDYGAYETQPAAIPLPAGNLLAAPGAEAPGAAGNSAASPAPPAPWTRTAGALTFARYGASFFPADFLGTLLGAGDALFIGGPSSALSTATQSVDLSSSARGIDTGGATATLSALLGGYGDEEDRASVTATFRDDGGAALGSATVGPVSRAERDNATILLPRSATAAIPAGTRSVLVELRAERVSADSYNDASFDDVALTAAIPTVPDPPTTPTTPTTSTTPTPPRSTPYAGLTLKRGRYRLNAKRRLLLPVACPATARTACTGTLTLRAKVTRRVKGKKRTSTVVLGRATVKVAAGRSATVRLTVSPKGRALVPAKGRTVTLAASTRDAAGGTARTTTKTITVLRAKRR